MKKWEDQAPLKKQHGPLVLISKYNSVASLSSQRSNTRYERNLKEDDFNDDELIMHPQTNFATVDHGVKRHHDPKILQQRFVESRVTSSRCSAENKDPNGRGSKTHIRKQ